MIIDLRIKYFFNTALDTKGEMYFLQQKLIAQKTENGSLMAKRFEWQVIVVKVQFGGTILLVEIARQI